MRVGIAVGFAMLWAVSAGAVPVMLARSTTEAVQTAEVNSLEDTSDFLPGDGSYEDASGATTLRAALEEFRAQGVAGQVRFDPALFAGEVPKTLALTRGTLLIRGDMSIEGPGQELLTLSGLGKARHFFVNSGHLQLSLIHI